MNSMKQAKNSSMAERKNRFMEKQAMINAIEEADELAETKKLADDISKKEKVLSLSKTRGKSAGKSEKKDEVPSISKINKDVADNRP
jgi:hypothetical protein